MNEQINNGGQGQQAARVDDMDAAADRLGDYLVRELSVYLTHKSLRAALEAALPQPLIHESGAMSSESGQPAERQGEAVASLRIFDAATDGIPSYALGRLPAMDRLPVGEYRLHLHSAAPVGVPDGMVPADAMRNLYRAYVRTLEAGLDRITSLGGDCDSVEHMEHTDPALIVARRILAAAPSAREVQA